MYLDVTGTISISLTDGSGQETVTLSPEVGVLTDIRVTSGDNISMTCNVTLDDPMDAGDTIVVWKKENATVSVGEALTSFRYNERVCHRVMSIVLCFGIIDTFLANLTQHLKVFSKTYFAVVPSR